MPETESGVTVQDPKAKDNNLVSGSVFNMMFRGSDDRGVPKYGSSRRDEYNVNHVTAYGNDLLAGAVSNLQAKIVATHWFVEGPLELARQRRNTLLYQSDFRVGWESMVAPWVHGYLCRDGGGIVENLRTSRSDHEGPSMGFAHIDESKMRRTGDAEWPFEYRGKDGTIKMHRSQVSPIVDMRDGRDALKGIGFCGVSRTLSTSHILMDVVTYKREMLSDLPPAGILFINNMTEKQWEDLQAKYDARQHNSGSKVWRDIMVALGVDPQFPVSAELFQLRQLWESFDEKTQMEMAVYSFALGFRVDPREFWPVSSGSLGTATEAEIQHRKARAKGEGAIFSAIERTLNGPYGLGEAVRFRFDFRDDDEDQQAAEIAKLKIENIRKMWEASPNAFYHQLQEPESVEEADEVSERAEQDDEREDDDSNRQVPGVGDQVSDIVGIGGMISTEEARNLLVSWNIIDPAILGEQVNHGRVYDVRGLIDAYGPWVRLYDDGKIDDLSKSTRTYF